MEMSEDEILQEADRIRVKRGLRVARECGRCGDSFLGSGDERYCSNDCESASQRDVAERQHPEPQQAGALPAIHEGETYREYFTRIASRPLNADDEAFFDAIDRIQAMWANAKGPRRNSLELIHEGREERLRQLTSQ
jgi:hypothetical protein